MNAHSLRVGAGLERHRTRPRERRDGGERRQMPDVLDVGIREGVRERQHGILRIHQPQPIRVDELIRRPQQQAIDDVEHRRVRTDAEREDHDNGAGHTRRAPQSSYRVP